MLVSPGTLNTVTVSFSASFGRLQEPFGIGPGLHHLLRIGVARFGFLFHVVEVIEHQQGVRQRFGGNRCQGLIVKRLDQRMAML